MDGNGHGGLNRPEDHLIIAGGGLVGSSLALAAADGGIPVTVIEPFPADSNEQPSFDERTIAITWVSRMIFQGLGIWDQIAPEAGAIESIHVSRRGKFGETLLHRTLTETEALGYVIPTRAVGQTLHQHLIHHPMVTLRCPDTAISASTGSNSINVVLKDGDPVSGSVLVVADGGRSPLYHSLGVEKKEKPYRRQALVTIVAMDTPHGNRAYERFDDHGPLALLPMTDNRMALVWTITDDMAPSLSQITDPEFLDLVQQKFGYRAGRFVRVGIRKSYPLTLTHAGRPATERACLAGNAAHTVHPVAGQGFNLGLREVADLAESLVAARQRGDDIGSRALLDTHHQNRERRTRRVLKFTDFLVSWFSPDIPGLNMLRSTGLTMVDLSAMTRRKLLLRTMGLHGRRSWLSLGESLKNLPEGGPPATR